MSTVCGCQWILLLMTLVPSQSASSARQIRRGLILVAFNGFMEKQGNRERSIFSWPVCVKSCRKGQKWKWMAHDINKQGRPFIYINLSHMHSWVKGLVRCLSCKPSWKISDAVLSFTDLFLDDTLCDYLLAFLLAGLALSCAAIQFGHYLVNKEKQYKK